MNLIMHSFGYLEKFKFFFILIIFFNLNVDQLSENVYKISHSHKPFEYEYERGSGMKMELIGWVEQVKPEITIEYYEQAAYMKFLFKEGAKEFILTNVLFSNGNMMYFVQNHRSDKANHVTLHLEAPSTPENIKKFNPRERHVSPANWETIQLASEYQTPIYVDSKELYYRIGAPFSYRDLGHTVIQVVDSGSIKSALDDESVHYFIDLKATEEMGSEAWGVISDIPLINWEVVDNTALQIEFDVDKKLRVNGVYYETPNSYIPYTENSFYLNPANLDGLMATDLAKQNEGTYFFDIATHIAYNSLKNQTDDGYWVTSPKSSWLSGDYDIGYHYMDNRRNADNTTFLLRYYRLTSDKDVLNALLQWEEYLVDYAYQHGISSGEGIMLPDYIDPDGEYETTHVSLNHHVSILNYILERTTVIEDNNNEKLLKLAHQLLIGVEVTADVWVKPDHNLYYSLNNKLQPNVNSRDYITLTRDDLALTNRLLKLIYGEENESIRYLIKEKNIWIHQYCEQNVCMEY